MVYARTGRGQRKLGGGVAADGANRSSDLGLAA
ncbi:hypothetical protein JTE90_013618, partial [Oedothorax gibbosus]